jgi:hypothetical protein
MEEGSSSDEEGDEEGDEEERVVPSTIVTVLRTRVVPGLRKHLVGEDDKVRIFRSMGDGGHFAQSYLKPSDMYGFARPEQCYSRIVPQWSCGMVLRTRHSYEAHHVHLCTQLQLAAQMTSLSTE